jgi:hypothetical protein
MVGSSEFATEIGSTVLYRTDVERQQVADTAAALENARSRPPNVVVVRDENPDATQALIRRLKEGPETRRASVVVLSRKGTDETYLKRAGASLVIAPPIDPFTWDDRLEELLSEPRRRDVRIPARFVVWPRPLEAHSEGVALNVSVRGMLLETRAPLQVGTTLELTFELPGNGAPTQVVGQVVRQAPSLSEALLYGIDFIILRGDSRSRIHAFVEAETRR